VVFLFGDPVNPVRKDERITLEKVRVLRYGDRQR